MIFKVVHPRKETRSFRDTIRYILMDRKVDWRFTGNIASDENNPKSIATEMRCVALQNARVKHPGLHIVLSWNPGDVVDESSMKDAVHKMVDRLGLQDHQWVAAAHKDAMQPHVHFIACRVNLFTLRAARLSFDYLTLRSLATELELAYGWRQSVSRISANQTVEISGKRWRLRDLLPAQLNQRAQHSTRFLGVYSFQEWLAGEPRNALFTVLNSSNPSWDDVHRTLGIFSLVYLRYGKGAAIRDRDDSRLHARAIHLAGFAGLPSLEKILGPFKPAGSAIEFSPGYRHSVPALRDQWATPDLMRAYRRYRATFASDAADRWRGQRALEGARRHEIHAIAADKRLALQASPLPALTSREQRRLVALDTRFKLAMLDGTIASERRALSIVKKPLAPRAWLMALAKHGEPKWKLLAQDCLDQIKSQEALRTSQPSILDLSTLREARLALPSAPRLNLEEIPWPAGW